MITFPSRVAELRKRLEAGEPVTQADVNRLATLQLLDLAVIGEDFAREAIQREVEQTEEWKRAV